jgi:hypothetical protein
MDPAVSFPEVWTPPRELARALPRDVGLSGLGMFKAILAVALAVAAIPVFLTMRGQYARQVAQMERLRTEGREAQGEIVRLWRQGRSSTHMVAYAFSVEEQRFHGQASAPSGVWDGLRKAGFLPVRFLPEDPKINHPAAWAQSPLPAWLPLILAVLLVACGVAILAVLRRQARLLAEGLPAPGVVTRCFRIKGGWAVRYQFRMKDGAIAKGSSQSTHRLQTGAAVCVLYLKENPRRNQTYPLCSYRLVL